MTALAQAKMGGRYLTNLVSMTAREDGYPAAARVGARFIATETRKIPRVIRRAALGSESTAGVHPSGYSEEIIEALAELPVPFRSYRIEPESFYAHVRSVGYPRAYAAGPLEEGGNRENKLLEYFVALEILDIQPDDLVIDVASEHSIFPSVVRETYGSTVFRQDLIYPPGVHGDRIGGSAASMPVGDRFADKLVLHNSFEHFEGSADSDFIAEAWRVLRPGGVVCIVPLFVSERLSILSDPLTDRSGIVWDPGAEVIELPWWHNRFGRFYDAASLEERVLSPAREVGFGLEILHFDTIKDVHPLAAMYFALVLRKPE
jgi:hypothetical protein